MTLSEKVSQLMDDAVPIPRLGVPKFRYWSEALHGVARKGYATNFPQAIGLGATWDTELLHKVGGIISTEARALHNESLRPGYDGPSADLTYWSPNINIFRDSRWGRGQETYGEDPFLTARMGVAYIKGMQGDNPKYLKVIATPKHYAVHSGPEPLRHKFNVDVSAHDLEDTYLPAFRAAITDGHAESIMCAYNAVDDVPACASKMLLQDYLRSAWKFTGFVVSDCDAVDDVTSNHHFSPDGVHGAAASLVAGTDLDCGGAYRALEAAVTSKLIDESAIDTAVANLFTARFRLGLFDPANSVPYDKIPASEINSAEHREVSLRAARESIVLLKNQDQILPLSAGVRTIAVVGPLAQSLEAIHGDYSGALPDPVYPVQGIETQFSGHAKVLYSQGSNLTPDSTVPLPSYAVSARRGDQMVHGFKGEYFENPRLEGTPTAVRIDDVIDFDWNYAKPDPSVGLREYSVRWTGSFRAPAAGEYSFEAKVHDCTNCKMHEQFRLFVDDKLVLDSSRFQTDTAGKSRDAVMLSFGDSQPHALRYEYVHHNSEAGTTLAWRAPAEVLKAEAIKAAMESDVVVAIVGITRMQEDEGHDRTAIDLPPMQEDLVESLSKTGKPLVVVLLNGSPLAVNWAQAHANAILEAWYPGEAGGTAIAETLAGTNNPAGRLPVTFYRSLEQLPEFTDYSMTNRTYRYSSSPPLYPFGYGLSYSTFSYSDLKLVEKQLRAGDTVSVEADVTNTSNRDGDEVSQLYLKAPSMKGGPSWALQGFTRINVGAHNTQHLHFDLSARQLSSVDSKGKRAVRPGEYTVYVGGGQPNGALPTVAGTFRIRGTATVPR